MGYFVSVYENVAKQLKVNKKISGKSFKLAGTRKRNIGHALKGFLMRKKWATFKKYCFC